MTGPLGALGNADIYSDAARLKTLISHVGYGPTDFFVPATGGRNSTTAKDLMNNHALGILFDDAETCSATGHFLVPNNFKGNLTLKVVIRPESAGNIYGSMDVRWGSCGEDYYTHSNGAPVYSAVAVTATNYNNCIYSVSLDSAVAGDIVSVTFTRDATNALDTVNDGVSCPGFLAEYN